MISTSPFFTPNATAYAGNATVHLSQYYTNTGKMSAFGQQDIGYGNGADPNIFAWINP